jgi:hypothetical protein
MLWFEGGGGRFGFKSVVLGLIKPRLTIDYTYCPVPPTLN